MRKAILFAVLLLPVLCSTATAWSTKEHILLTRLAVSRLLAKPDTPAEMKTWLRAAAPGLPDIDGNREFLLRARTGVFPRGVDGIPFWSVVPDLEALTNGSGDRARKVEPFGVPERALHFIDLELFM